MIAEIAVDLETRRIRKITFHTSRLTFKCQRCGVFCCELGGPKLSENDVDRLKQAGYIKSEFLDVDHKSLRNRADGSCIFLSIDTSTHLYKCSIYALRPALCRLYPFQLKKSGRNSYCLSVIPCCMGLNTEGGEDVDTSFVSETVGNILSELTGTDLI